MGDEVQAGAVLPAREVATPVPSSGAAPTTAPVTQPVEPVAPQYLTRQEALELRRELDNAKSEIRGLQGVIDRSGISKAALKQRLGPVEEMLKRQQATGLIDESQASQLLDSERARAIADLLPEDEEPQRGGGNQAQSQLDPMQQRAMQLVKESGLTEADPEYQTLYGHADPFSWYQALDRAKATKQARLAREQAAVTAQTQPKPPPAPTAQPGATAVEVGSGGGAPVTDLGALQKQLTAAIHSGNLTEAQRIRGEIYKLAGLGGG